MPQKRKDQGGARDVQADCQIHTDRPHFMQVGQRARDQTRRTHRRALRLRAGKLFLPDNSFYFAYFYQNAAIKAEAEVDIYLHLRISSA